MLYGRFAITMSYHKKVNAVALFSVTDNNIFIKKRNSFIMIRSELTNRHFYGKAYKNSHIIKKYIVDFI